MILLEQANLLMKFRNYRPVKYIAQVPDGLGCHTQKNKQKHFYFGKSNVLHNIIRVYPCLGSL